MCPRAGCVHRSPPPDPAPMGVSHGPVAPPVRSPRVEDPPDQISKEKEGMDMVWEETTRAQLVARVDLSERY